MPRKKKTDLEQEAGIVEDDDDIDQADRVDDNKDDKKGAEYRALTTKLAEQRLIRLRHQNAKLRFELRKLRGQIGDIEKLKREVIAANVVVKQQLLAIPFRLAATLASLSDPRMIAQLLHGALTDALNDLAYEREKEPDKPAA